MSLANIFSSITHIPSEGKRTILKEPLLAVMRRFLFAAYILGLRCCFASLLHRFVFTPSFNHRGALLRQCRYSLQNPLNSGSQGEVWTAVDRNNNNSLVKIKITNCDRTDLKNAYRMAKNERYVIKALNNHFFLKHLDSFQENGFYYHVTEYVDSITLKEHFYNLRSTLPFAIEIRFKKVAYLLLEAMHLLHQFGIVHQDIKPGNVIVHNNGESLKLIDFGLAYLYDRKNERRFEQDAEINGLEPRGSSNSTKVKLDIQGSIKTKMGTFGELNAPSKNGSTGTSTNFSSISTVGGTIQFVPPEVIQGKLLKQRPETLITPFNDVYAFGITLFIGFYGELPRVPIEDEDPAYLESKRLFECPRLENLIRRLIRFDQNYRLKDYESIKKHEYFYECYSESSV